MHTYAARFVADQVTGRALAGVRVSVEDAETGLPVQTYRDGVPVSLVTGPNGLIPEWQTEKSTRRVTLTAGSVRLTRWCEEIHGTAADAVSLMDDRLAAAASAANQAATIRDGLEPRVQTVEARQTALESATGFGPSTPADGQTASLVLQPGTQTRAALEDVVGLVQEDGHVKHEAVKIGRTQLDFLYGNGGDRVQLRGIPGIEAVDGKPAPMPYFEVRAAREGEGTDIGHAIGGYQAHWVGDGTTPNDQPRSYWFVELKSLEYVPEGHEEARGGVGIGTSRRGTERPRAMYLHAGGRLGTIFHPELPFVEVTRNTALLFDDRQRGSYGIGTIHGGTIINGRREGNIGIKLESVADSAASRPLLEMARSRGTAAAPTDPATGDTLGEITWGSNLSPRVDRPQEYTHRSAAGVRAVMREDWTSTGRGSRVEILTSPLGSSARQVSATVQASGLVMDHRSSLTATDPTAEGTMVNLRREGYAHLKVESVGNGSFPTVRLSRSRGTVAAPSDPQINDSIGEIDFGSTTGGDDPSAYTHRSAGGVRMSMREDWTSTGRGSKVELMATAKGQSSRQVVATLQVPDQNERTGLILIARGADGTLGSREVLVGPRDSAGAGYMTLRIQNLPA